MIVPYVKIVLRCSNCRSAREVEVPMEPFADKGQFHEAHFYAVPRHVIEEQYKPCARCLEVDDQVRRGVR